MAKFTATCTHEGCTKVFKKTTQAAADQALRMHFGRKHGNNGGNPKLNGGRTPRSGRRLSIKRRLEQAVTVNFCPNCGCDVHRVAMGMVLAAKIK